MSRLAYFPRKRQLSALGLTAIVIVSFGLLALRFMNISPAAAASNSVPHDQRNPIAAAPLPYATAASAVGAGMYDDTDAHFVYSGTWYASSTSTDSYKSTMHYTNDPKARVALTFNGTGFVLYRVTYTNRGLMDIYIDGEPYQRVTNFSAGTAWQVPLVVQGLKSGVHTVEFANTPQYYMDVDAVLVLNGEYLPPTHTAAVAPTAKPIVIQPANNVPLAFATPGFFNYKALVYSGIEAAQGDMINNLYTVNPVTNDSPIVPITTAPPSPGFLYPVWSLDGKKIAYSDQNKNLNILDLSTKPPTNTLLQTVNNIKLFSNSPVAWDPSGAARLAYVDSARGGLRVADFTVPTATVTFTVDATGAAPNQVSWQIEKSTGTAFIAYQTLGTTSEAFINKIDSKCVPTLIGGTATPTPAPCLALQAIDAGAVGALNGEPAFSPDARYLAYVSDRAAKTATRIDSLDIFIYDSVTGKSTQVTSIASKKASPTWSPDGQSIAYVDINSKAIVLLSNVFNITTPITTSNVVHAATSITSVSWSPAPFPTYTPTPVPTLGPSPTVAPSATTGPSPTTVPSATTTLTPSATATAVPPPVQPVITFTADNFAPIPFSGVGTATSSSIVNFTATITNPVGGATLTNISVILMLSGVTQPLQSAASLAPGAPALSFQFRYIVTANDVCNLNPMLSISFNGNGVQSPVQTMQVTNGSTGQAATITVQRLGVSQNVSSSVTNISVGSGVTFTDIVTNNGCLPETVNVTDSRGNTLSQVLSGGATGNPQIQPNTTATFTLTRIVTTADQANPQIIFNAIATGNTSGNAQPPNTPLPPVSAPAATVTLIFATVTSTPSTALFSITKTANVSSVTPGQDITFTITITNTSGSTLTGITLTDNVPTDTMTVKTAASDVGSATNSGNNITGIVTLTTGQVAHITITATVLATVKSPTIITNAATASINGANSLSASVNVPLATTSGGTGGTAGVLPTTGGGSPDVQSLVGLFGLVAAGVVALSAFGVLRRVRR